MNESTDKQDHLYNLGLDVHKTDTQRRTLEIEHQLGWLSWRSNLGFLSDRRIPITLKGEFIEQIQDKQCFMVPSVVFP